MAISMKILLLATVSATLLISGCSSNPKGHFNIASRRVTILTDPEGATVTQINPFNQPSSSLGLSPIKDRSVMIVSKITRMKNMPYHETKKLMEQVDNVVVRIEKDGYETYKGTLKTNPKETVVHTIALQPKEPESK